MAYPSLSPCHPESSPGPSAYIPHSSLHCSEPGRLISGCLLISASGRQMQKMGRWETEIRYLFPAPGSCGHSSCRAALLATALTSSQHYSCLHCPFSFLPLLPGWGCMPAPIYTSQNSSFSRVSCGHPDRAGVLKSECTVSCNGPGTGTQVDTALVCRRW